MTYHLHIEVGEISVAYRRAGHGPPIVLLHGFACDSRIWQLQLEGLSDQFDVIAWDAPGTGASSDPPDLFDTGDWARSLTWFLDALDVETAHIVGLSWGGILAQELYRLDSSRVRSLILAGTYAGWKGSLPRETVERRLSRCLSDSSLAPEEFAATWVSEFFTTAAPKALREEMATIVIGFHPLGFRLMARSSADTDTTALLPKIEVPTLLVWGDGDARSPLSIAKQFHEAIPGAEFALIKGAGHVSNMERPDEFNAVVRRFVLTQET